MDGAAAITDSTDWTSTTLPGFASLDSALRCQVCKDFYDTPMMTSCAHTFCSLCIRRCLSSDGKCPACRAGDQASKLRRNWAVQEVVDAFKANRQAAFELALKKPALQASSNAVNGQKRKRDALNTADGRPPRETRRTRQQAQKEAQSQETIVLDSDAEGSDEEVVTGVKNTTLVEPDDGLVPCPICSHRMKEEAVFSHLDMCTGVPPAPVKSRAPSVPQTTTPTNTTPQPPATRIPQLNYSLLKDNALRKKLQELGIPSTGPRQLLIKRHTEWADLYNANCDSAQPRPRRALLQDLQTWERSQGGGANQAAGVFGGVGTAQGQIMAKDFDGDGWKERHKGQFSDLVAQARARGKSSTSDVVDAEVSGIRTSASPKRPLPALETHQTQSTTPASEQGYPSKRRRSSMQLPPDASPISRLFCDAAESLPTSPRKSPSGSPPGISVSPSGVRKVPMFQVPEDPIRDLDGSA